MKNVARWIVLVLFTAGGACVLGAVFWIGGSILVEAPMTGRFFGLFMIGGGFVLTGGMVALIWDTIL